METDQAGITATETTDPNRRGYGICCDQVHDEG